MNPKFILLGLVLICSSFLSQQAFAATECSNISVDTYTVRIEAGKSSIESFTIRNFASERFFVDSANAFDSSPNFNVETSGYERIIPSQGTGAINVKVTGKNYNSGIIENAFIGLRGHFLNGNACELQAIGAKKFSVIVEKALELPAIVPLRTACNNVFLSVPSNIQIRNNFGAIELSIDNKSSYRATIRISGKNATANPALVSIPKNSSLTETIEIVATESNAELEFFVENVACGFSRKTAINSIQGLAEIASISAETIGLNSAAYEAVIAIENKSGEPITGNIEFLLPENWKIEGRSIVETDAFGKITAKFKITTNEALKENFIGGVSFKSRGESISTGITFKPKENIQGIAGTMFAILGNNILGGALVILIIIIVALFILAFYSRKQKRIVLITKPKEVKA